MQYLEAEIEYALEFISTGDHVLEVGCGYGRILAKVFEKSESITGIDTSFDNLVMAKRNLNVHLCQMNASTLGFPDNQFDVLLCLQNGISAFKVDPVELVKESIRVTRPGGICLFSSYSPKFWNERLEWFQLQSNEGLLGEIDYTLTKNGVIACKDGFRSTSFGAEEFSTISEEIGIKVNVIEIDESSIFCEIRV
jgi:2-polyprenyl-6-hydroxyphenyl methylase/3-demethylubiquinone-9 3-methyltransferase